MHAPQRMQRSISCMSPPTRLGASRVDQNEIHMLRPVAVERAARPGKQAHVVRDRLAGRRARQEAQQRREILQRRDHLLDAGQAHVHARQRRHHAAVALVGDDHARAAFGDQKVAAREAEVGRKEVPRSTSRASRVMSGMSVLARRAVAVREEVRDLVLVLVQRRRDDVRGRLSGELQDVFAEVGLDRGHARRLERLVDAGLLREHRFRLDRLLHAVAPADVQRAARRLLSRVSAKSTVAPRRVASDSKRSIQASRFASARSRIAAPSPRSFSNRSGPKSATALARSAVKPVELNFCRLRLQGGVSERLRRARLEVHRADLHQALPRRGTSATCSTRVFASPRLRSRPSMLSMQPRSPSTTACAPLAAMCAHFALGHFRGDVAVLDRERAAETAAGLALLHLDELEASHLGEELPRLRLHAQLAQARARIVVGHGAVEGRRNSPGDAPPSSGIRSARRCARRGARPWRASGLAREAPPGNARGSCRAHEPEGTTT